MKKKGLTGRGIARAPGIAGEEPMMARTTS